MSDEHAQFEQVFEDCYEAVYRYAARRVPPEAVQDIVSDTFLAGWRRHRELKGEPLPWLLGIARRSAANNRRSRARRDALHERLSAEPAATKEIQLGVEDPRLAAALATLAERDREALMLIAWEGLEHRAAARVLGCSTGAFTVRLHRARRRLARALDGEQSCVIDVTEEARSLP